MRFSELQFGKVKSLEVYKKDSFDTFDLSVYNEIPDNFRYIKSLLTHFKMLIESREYKEAFKIVCDRAEKYHYKKHLSEPLDNSLVSLVTGNEDIDLIVTKNKLHAMNGFYNDVIRLTEARKKYKISMDSIKALYPMLSICLSNGFSVDAVRKNGNLTVKISAVDNSYTEMVKSFIASIEDKDKRIILTSGTLSSYDYQQLFKNELKTRVFGKNGDSTQYKLKNVDSYR